MKHFFIIVIVCSCIACKKTYTCECSFKSVKTDHVLPNETKKQATAACDEITASWQDSDGSCSLIK
jgi:hypothetical protein